MLKGQRSRSGGQYTTKQVTTMITMSDTDSVTTYFSGTTKAYKVKDSGD